MSIQIMSQVWSLQLSKPKQAVLLAMADHADSDGNNVRPGTPLIAWKTDFSERHTRRIIDSLVADGLLVVVATPAGKPVEYRIDIGAGVRKPAFNPGHNYVTPDNATPDIQVSPLTRRPLTNPHVTPDTVMSGEPSLEPEEQIQTHPAPVREEPEWLSDDGGYDPRPTDDVAWGLGMGFTSRLYGSKAERARQHPLVKAYLAGFPEGQRPPVDDAFLAIAERMAEHAYAAADVTALVASKLPEKPGYPLRWCEQDMPTFLAQKNAPAKPHNTGPLPRPSKPNNRVSPLPPLIEAATPAFAKAGAS